MKNFEDLTISDDYMFYHVMQNKDLCKTLLTSILSGKIAEITTIEIQKTFETSTNAKGIRLDVWIIDSTGKQYNIEMQTTANRDLARRMRYYQSAIDSHLLEKGRHYSDLADTFIIFICPFDYPKKGLPIYSFTAICNEDKTIELDDGTTKILVNSSAAHRVKDKNLRAFLEYMNGRETENDFVKSLKHQIETFKHNNKMREEYMYRMTVEDEIRHDALQEGMQQGIYKEKENIVLKMVSRGLDVKTISEYTDLDISEVKKIKDKSSYP